MSSLFLTLSTRALVLRGTLVLVSRIFRAGGLQGRGSTVSSGWRSGVRAGGNTGLHPPPHTQEEAETQGGDINSRQDTGQRKHRLLMSSPVCLQPTTAASSLQPLDTRTLPLAHHSLIHSTSTPGSWSEGCWTFKKKKQQVLGWTAQKACREGRCPFSWFGQYRGMREGRPAELGSQQAEPILALLRNQTCWGQSLPPGCPGLERSQ